VRSASGHFEHLAHCMPCLARSTPLCVIGSINTKKNPLPHALFKCDQYERVETGRVVPAAVQCRIQYNRESTDNNIA
jgi:hypothetical protein